jgi:hypothetical protein
MNEDLAKRILFTTMGWMTDDISKEMADIQLFARYKYDNYQRFFPGMRFMESLSQWLNQFENIEERKIAYKFIKERLVFFSETEFEQLISMAYPDYIKPYLFEQTAKLIPCPDYHVYHISESQEFKILRRQSLFLGLSDGARIDLFRRVNREEGVQHDQISLEYDIAKNKSDDLLEELEKDLTVILGRPPNSSEKRFKNLFLIDDFSASGKSYLREQNGELKGKIAKVLEMLDDPKCPLSQIVDKENCNICIVLYIATNHTIEYLNEILTKILKERATHFRIFCVQRLDEKLKLNSVNEEDNEFLKLVDKYYDSDIESLATKVGGTDDVKLGFANCALPVVLYHNTPNNSIALLWSHEDLDIKGLFPRITRH